jgi:histidine triad (HIT) family protein
MRETDPDCVFCGIVAGRLPSDKLYEDDEMIAIRDISPAAPLHLLVLPKAHIATINDLESEESGLIGRMTLVARDLAVEAGVAEDGYRMVMNVNSGGGQVVFHIHMHLVGGRQMGAIG